MTIRFAALVAAALALGTTAAFAMDATKTQDTNLGTVLADAQGMTLYTFRKDSPGKTVCYGGCAKLWPPLTAAADATAEGDYTLVARKGGAKQWAYKGLPLYRWSKDKKPGDTTGQGVKNLWDVARP